MLDDASTDGDDIGALIDRLTIRLGRERVRRLVPGDSHIPEQAAFDLPATTTQSRTWLAAVDGEPPMRPLCLFDPPQRIGFSPKFQMVRLAHFDGSAPVILSVVTKDPNASQRSGGGDEPAVRPVIIIGSKIRMVGDSGFLGMVFSARKRRILLGIFTDCSREPLCRTGDSNEFFISYGSRSPAHDGVDCSVHGARWDWHRRSQQRRRCCPGVGCATRRHRNRSRSGNRPNQFQADCRCKIGVHRPNSRYYCLSKYAIRLGSTDAAADGRKPTG